MVSLLIDGKIPYFEVGSHRRIKFKDLQSYKVVRDSERQSGLRKLFDRIQEDDHYEDIPKAVLSGNYEALLDSCVLLPPTLCDLFLKLAGCRRLYERQSAWAAAARKARTTARA